MKRSFCAFGEFFCYSFDVARKFFSRRYSLAACTSQMYRVGVESLSVVNLCAFFIGLVLVVQTASMLARFGAKTQVSMIISASFVREIGPVFAAIMFTGRIGTGIAAEIGSMVVTEQIDAYRTFGADPVAKLAVPRVLATTFMLPALTLISSIIGIFSGYLVGVFFMGMEANVYIRNTLNTLTRVDVISCVVKGCVFGLMVGLISTHAGFRTGRATEAVGVSTTRTMVEGVLSILIVDLILTKFFLIVGGY